VFVLPTKTAKCATLSNKGCSFISKLDFVLIIMSFWSTPFITNLFLFLSFSLWSNPFKPSEWTYLIFPLLLIERKIWKTKPLNQTILQALFSLQVMVPMMLALTFWKRGTTKLLPFQLLLYSPPSLLFLVHMCLALLWVTVL